MVFAAPRVSPKYTQPYADVWQAARVARAAYCPQLEWGAFPFGPIAGLCGFDPDVGL